MLEPTSTVVDYKYVKSIIYYQISLFSLISALKLAWMPYAKRAFQQILLAYETTGQQGLFLPTSTNFCKTKDLQKIFLSEAPRSSLRTPDYSTAPCRNTPLGHASHIVHHQYPDTWTTWLAEWRCQLQGVASVQETLKQLSPPRYTRW